MAFDEQDVPPGAARLGLKNYWGYSPHSFFSPHPGYCVTPELGTHRREFKDLVERHADLLQFVQRLIAFRKRHSCLRRRRFLTGGLVPNRGIADVAWHGSGLHAPQWGDPDGQLLAYTLGAMNDSEAGLHVIFNMSDRACEIELPSIAGRVWQRALDTSLDSLHDVPDRKQQQALDLPRYPVQSRSVMVLEGWSAAR